MSKHELVVYWNDVDNGFLVEVPELPASLMSAENIFQEWSPGGFSSPAHASRRS